jgi:hypothetical protein
MASQKITPEISRTLIDYHDRLAEIVKNNPAEVSAYVEALHESGEPTALMDMIYWCVKFEWILPPWAAKAFIERADRVRYGEVGSWDDALGRPYPVGKHVSRVRESRRSWPIYIRVRQRVNEGAALTDPLFEEVGVEFDVGKTRCKELYYGAAALDAEVPTALQAAREFREIVKTGGIT